MGRETGFFSEHRSDVALILLDPSQRILSCNALADQLLARENGLERRGGRLQVGSREFADHMERLASGKPVPQESTMLVHHKGAPLVVRTKTAWRIDDPCDVPRAVLVLEVIDPEHPSLPRPSFLRSLYGLTNAEANVALGVAAGWSLERIAINSGRRISTVRTLLKRAYGKTGTHRQHQLASLVTRLFSLE